MIPAERRLPVVDIYISGIQPFMDLDGIDLLTAERKARALRYIRNADRARCVASGLLLRKICGVTDERQITYGKNGKPYLSNGSMHFSLSHSGGYAILAAADAEIGADIEKITAYDGAVAARCFTEEELRWLEEQGGDEAFFVLWTAKESVMKASGLGFSLPPRSFCVLPVDSSLHRVSGGEWSLSSFTYNGHVICGASSDKIKKTRLIETDPGVLLER
jgi:4'-phosphopantetheinyl transferase